MPLEFARTRVAMGKNKSPEERLARVGAAEADLRDFIAKNQGKPEAAAARVEMSRLAIIQGQAVGRGIGAGISEVAPAKAASSAGASGGAKKAARGASNAEVTAPETAQ